MSNPEIQISNQNPSWNPVTQTKLPITHKIYRDSNNENLNAYLTFEQRLEQSPYWVSFEEHKTKAQMQKAKKEIVSYNANRDKLFIPKPERTKREADINKNIVEDVNKPVTADWGIQSDKIDYVNPEKPFRAQKIGKDQGTQIWDGELFNFDHDVQPLLTVIIGKTIEQSWNEILQEDEIATLRETKAMYLRKKNDDMKRIRNLEDKEIQKKFNNDNKKDKRKVERENRKWTQMQLISRVISKVYLKDLKGNAMKDWLARGQFRNYTQTIVKNETNRIIKSGSEAWNVKYGNLQKFIGNMLMSQHSKNVNKHVKAIKERHEYLQRMNDEAIQRKKEEEERIIQEALARKERRRKRKLERLIKVIKAETKKEGEEGEEGGNEEEEREDSEHREDEQEDNTPKDLGGIMEFFMSILSILRGDEYASLDIFNIENVTELLNKIFSDCKGFWNFKFNGHATRKIKTLFRKKKEKVTEKKTEEDEEDGDNASEANQDSEEEQIDISNLKTMTDLGEAQWEKISHIWSKLDLNSEVMIKDFIEKNAAPIKNQKQTNTNEENEEENKEEGEDGEEAKEEEIEEPDVTEVPETLLISKDFYTLVFKSIVEMCVKANNVEHFNFWFDDELDEVEKEGKKEGQE